MGLEGLRAGDRIRYTDRHGVEFDGTYAGERTGRNDLRIVSMELDDAEYVCSVVVASPETAARFRRLAGQASDPLRPPETAEDRPGGCQGGPADGAVYGTVMLSG